MEAIFLAETHGGKNHYKILNIIYTKKAFMFILFVEVHNCGTYYNIMFTLYAIWDESK
jgi:hypothetical protein